MEYEAIKKIGDKVMVELEVNDFDLDTPCPVHMEDGQCKGGMWLTIEQALKAGIIKEKVREPQVGDVYTDGYMQRVIVYLNQSNVYYDYHHAGYDESGSSGTPITEIVKWGELQ